MGHPALAPATVVADVLTGFPRAASVFIELRLDCLGCELNTFCSLQDVCDQYGFGFPSLLRKIQVSMESEQGVTPIHH